MEYDFLYLTVNKGEFCNRTVKMRHSEDFCKHSEHYTIRGQNKDKVK